jgi:hypothetical protein
VEPKHLLEQVAYCVLIEQEYLHLRGASAGAATGDILALRDYLRDVALYALDNVHGGRVRWVVVYRCRRKRSGTLSLGVFILECVSLFHASEQGNGSS